MEEGRNGGGTAQARGGVLYNLDEVAKAEAQERGAINSGVSPITSVSEDQAQLAPRLDNTHSRSGRSNS